MIPWYDVSFGKGSDSSLDRSIAVVYNNKLTGCFRSLILMKDAVGKLILRW
jgi:hypothetical protein